MMMAHHITQCMQFGLTPSLRGGTMRYFAYGSNMDSERMKKRGVNYSRRECAFLKGHKLVFNKLVSYNPQEGYANIVPDENDMVEGVLYEISDSDLSKLDKYEGYPNHYGRIRVTVQLDDDQEVEAVIYIAQPDKVREGLKPSREYLKHLIIGGEGILSESYRRKLKLWKTLDQ